MDMRFPRRTKEACFEALQMTSLSWQETIEMKMVSRLIPTIPLRSTKRLWSRITTPPSTRAISTGLMYSSAYIQPTHLPKQQRHTKPNFGTEHDSPWAWATAWARTAISPIFTYEWDHAPPGQDQGAYHASEIS